MTAFGDTETHDEAQRLRASAVFDKPFAAEDLLTHVRYLLEREARLAEAFGDE